MYRVIWTFLPQNRPFLLGVFSFPQGKQWEAQSPQFPGTVSCSRAAFANAPWLPGILNIRLARAQTVALEFTPTGKKKKTPKQIKQLKKLFLTFKFMKRFSLAGTGRGTKVALALWQVEIEHAYITRNSPSLQQMHCLVHSCHALKRHKLTTQ